MALRDWFIKDVGWKLSCLVLAIAIWLTVNKILGETGPSTAALAGDKLTYDDLPVLKVSTAADVRNFRVTPNTVAVTVSGPPEAMAVLQANQVRAVVDLTGIESGKEWRRRVDVSTPPGVTLVSVKPAIVDVIAPPLTGEKP